MNTYELPVKIKITSEQIDNIVDSAINYCSYWCSELDIEKQPTEDTKYMSEMITRGGELKFCVEEFDTNDEGESEFILTLDKMLKGLAEYGEFDFDEFDGPMSDAAVQQALFGEVVYG